MNKIVVSQPEHFQGIDFFVHKVWQQQFGIDDVRKSKKRKIEAHKSKEEPKTKKQKTTNEKKSEMSFLENPRDLTSEQLIMNNDTLDSNIHSFFQGNNKSNNDVKSSVDKNFGVTENRKKQ